MATKKSPGEGSVLFNPSTKTFEARFYCKDPRTGKDVRKKFSGSTQAEAVKRGKAWLALFKRSGKANANKITLGAWIDSWLTNYVKLNVRTKTYNKMKSSMECYIKPVFGNLLLSAVSSFELQKHFNQLLLNGRKDQTPLSSSTVRITRRYLTQCLEMAIKIGVLTTANPCRTTVPAKLSTKEIRPLTQKQISHMMATLDSDLAKALETDNISKIFWCQTLRMGLLLALGTGVRAGELLALHWSEVILDDTQHSPYT